MTRFRPDRGFEGAVLRSTGVRDHLRDLAEEGAAIASRLAPDDPDTPATEDLAGSFRGEVILGADGYRGRILSMNYKAPFYEFGTIQNAPEPMLRPAVEDLGLTLDEDGAGEVVPDA